MAKANPSWIPPEAVGYGIYFLEMRRGQPQMDADERRCRLKSLNTETQRRKGAEFLRNPGGKESRRK